MPSRSQAYRADRPSVAELAAGAVVAQTRGSTVLVLHERTEDRWGFPKGHVDPGESLLEAARREIAEEAGLTELDLREEVGEVSYRFYDPRRQLNVFKTSVYFLATTVQTRTTLEPIFDEARWEPVAVARTLVRFETDRRILDAAAKLLPSRP